MMMTVPTCQHANMPTCQPANLPTHRQVRVHRPQSLDQVIQPAGVVRRNDQRTDPVAFGRARHRDAKSGSEQRQVSIAHIGVQDNT
jgi:hypothetical protein